MTYSRDDTERLLSFYNNLIAKYGVNDPRSLSWRGEISEAKRFFVLCEVGNLQNASVLDVGCGFGDLYQFLSKHGSNFSSKGIDVNPKMIEAAHLKCPNVDFEIADIGEYIGPKTDYVLASGVLSFKIPDYKKIYFDYIKKMFEISNIATAFNMLNAQYHNDDDIYVAWSIPEVQGLCAQLTDKITLRQDYLSQDFTMYLSH